MNKNLFSILIAIVILFIACDQNVKQDNAIKHEGSDKAGTALTAKHHDSSLHARPGAGSKKLTCCIGPPSRIKINTGKK